MAALLGILKAYFQDAFNLRAGVDVRVVGLVVVLIFLAEIHTSSELADDDEVSTTQQLLFQR